MTSPIEELQPPDPPGTPPPFALLNAAQQVSHVQKKLAEWRVAREKKKV